MRATLSRAPGAEPVPGYRLLDLLGRGTFGEVWKCEAPGGLLKAIKLVGTKLGAFDEAGESLVRQELRALDRVKAIRHPFVLSIERIEVRDGELVIVTELADESLQDVLQSYQKDGHPGIPRAELLGYLVEAAEVLDVMNRRHQLQHLDIKPGNIFLVDQHVKVGDFGLVRVLGDAGAQAEEGQTAGITPAYCAPETVRGAISPWTDQYSLAIVYQELLTGRLPFRAKHVRQLLLERLTADPDLTPLPAADQPVVARALSREPEQRFPTCTDFVRALIDQSAGLPSPSISPRPSPGAASTASQRSGKPDPACQGTRTVAGLETFPQSPEGPSDGTPLPGYQFSICLRHDPLSESWLVQSPQGRRQCARLIYGLADADVRRAAEAIRRLQAVRHPALAPVDVVPFPGRPLVLLSDPADGTLWQQFRRCQAQGLPGIPRPELLEYLMTAAEALDGIREQYQVQHLGLNPGCLLLHENRLMIGDYGVAQLLWLPAGEGLAQVNRRYTAPELFAKRVSPCCDQYSLALICHHLLTGQHPRRMQCLRRLQAAQWPVQLAEGALSAGDCRVFARALHVDPGQRFPSCSAFVKALEQTTLESEPQGPYRAVRLPPVLKSGTLLSLVTPPSSLPPASQVVDEWMRHAAGTKQVLLANGAPYLLEPGIGLQSTFGAQWPAPMARAKIEAFRQDWGAEIVRVQGHSFLLRVRVRAPRWQRWLGRRPGLEVQIDVCPGGEKDAALTQVTVQVRPVGCNPQQRVTLLEQHGPSLVRTLQNSLLTVPERRADARLPLPYPVQLIPVLDGPCLGDPIPGEGQDISSRGLRVVLPRKPGVEKCYIQAPLAPMPESAALLGRVLRMQSRKDGGYEAVVLFDG